MRFKALGTSWEGLHSAIRAEMEHRIQRRRVKKEGRAKSFKDKGGQLGSSCMDSAYIPFTISDGSSVLKRDPHLGQQWGLINVIFTSSQFL